MLLKEDSKGCLTSLLVYSIVYSSILMSLLRHSYHSASNFVLEHPLVFALNIPAYYIKYTALVKMTFLKRCRQLSRRVIPELSQELRTGIINYVLNWPSQELFI